MGLGLNDPAGTAATAGMGGGPGSWRIVRASATGTSHLSTGAPCQDASAAVVLPDGTAVMAVADGAGSAPLGGEGALVAAAFAVELAATHAEEMSATRLGGGLATPWSIVLGGVMRATRRAVARVAAAREVPLGDLATTLLVVVVTPVEMAVAQVGDGAVVCARGEDLEVVAAPARSEYLNETTFLTSSRWKEHLRVVTTEARALTALALLSDGLQLVALDLAGGTAHPPFFRPLYEFARSPNASDDDLAAFLASPRVCERTDDDKTLVLAVRA